MFYIIQIKIFFMFYILDNIMQLNVLKYDFNKN